MQSPPPHQHFHHPSPPPHPPLRRPRPTSIKKKKDVSKQVEVLIVMFPQNDYLHPKGAFSESHNNNKRLQNAYNAQCKRVLNQIKILRDKQLFDHCIVLKRQHYGNNISFASCMVGSSYEELVRHSLDQRNVATIIQKERCVYGRWGANLHDDFRLDTKDHELIVGMNPLNGDPSAFSNTNGNIRLTRGSWTRSTSPSRKPTNNTRNNSINTKNTYNVTATKEQINTPRNERNNDLKELIKTLGATRLFFCGVVHERNFFTTCLEAKVVLRIPFVIIVDACCGLDATTKLKARRAKLALSNSNELTSILSENSQKVMESRSILRPLPLKDENDVELKIPEKQKKNVTLSDIIRLRNIQRIKKKTVTMPSLDLLQSCCPNGISDVAKLIDNKKTSCLHILCSVGDNVLLNRLLNICWPTKSLPTLNIRDIIGRAPMVNAIEHNNSECVKILIEYSTRLGLPSPLWGTDYNGRTVLMVACSFGNSEEVAMLLKHAHGCHAQNKMSSLLTKQDKHGYTALHYAASGSPVTPGRISIVSEILSSSLSVFVRVEMLRCLDNRGWSALHLMGKNGMITSIPFNLFARNLKAIPFQEMTSEGVSVIHLAAWNGHDLAVRMLVSKLTRVTDDHCVTFNKETFNKETFNKQTQKQISDSTNSTPIRASQVTSVRAPWLDTMPKNILTQTTKRSELDACLLRGYTHTAAWLIRNGYFAGPQLPQIDIDRLMKLCVQSGDLRTFLSLLRSPTKITLDSGLIHLISALDSFPHEDGDFVTKFRHWVPTSIDVSLHALNVSTGFDKYVDIPIDVIKLIARSAHDTWANNARTEAPIVLQKGVRGTGFHTHSSTKEEDEEDEEEEDEEDEEEEQNEAGIQQRAHLDHHAHLNTRPDIDSSSSAIVGITYDQMDANKQRRMERVVKQTIMAMQSLGFELNGLGRETKKEAKRMLNSNVEDHDQYLNDIDSIVVFSYSNSILDDHHNNEADEEWRAKLDDQDDEDNDIDNNNNDNNDNNNRTSRVPTREQMSTLKRTLAINIHNMWAANKKGAGWMYGKESTTIGDPTIESGLHDDHKDHLRNENSHTAQKLDERLVPYECLMTLYRMRCETMADECVRILKRLGVTFRMTTKDRIGGIHLEKAWNRLRGNNDGVEDDMHGNGNIEDVRQLMMNQLLRRAIREKNVQAAEQLLTPNEQSGVHATVDAVDRSQRTVVHYSVLHGNIEILALLLRVGADAGTRDRTGITPIHLAAFLGHDDMVQLLLDEGASSVARDNNGWASIHHAAYSNNALCIRQLARDLIGPGRPGIDFVDALAMNWMANTTLMRGLHLGSKAATKRQRKSLIDSVVLKAEEMKNLVDLKKFKDTKYKQQTWKDRKFITPLTLAVQRLSLEAAASLILQGADPTLMDSTGVCPYDRALLMADELSGRLETLDEKVNTVHHLMAKGNVSLQWFKKLYHNCLNHFRRSQLSGFTSTADHHRLQGAHLKLLHRSLYDIGATRTSSKERSSAFNFLGSSAFLSSVNLKMTAKMFREQESEMQKLTHLRDSLVERYDTVVSVLHVMVKSPSVQNLRTVFAAMYFLRFFVLWFIPFAVVVFFSPMSLTENYQSKDVYSTTKRINMCFKDTWSQVNNVKDWKTFHQQHLMRDGRATLSSGPSVSSLVNECVAPFHEARKSTRIMGVVGNIRIETQSFQSSNTNQCSLPGGTVISPCYSTSYSSNMNEYWGNAMQQYYITTKNATDSVRELQQLHDKITPVVRRITTDINIYQIQLKVLVRLQFQFMKHPTGKITTTMKTSGGLLPSGLDTSPWLQRHAPSHLFVTVYTLLFFASLYLRYLDFKHRNVSFHHWISSIGNLLSLFTTLLTLVIVVFDVTTTAPALENIIQDILRSNSEAWLFGVVEYLDAISMERQLFSLQAIVIWIPLVLSLRMLPRVGPNIVALFNAIVNWTVAFYIILMFLIIFIVSMALFVAFGSDSIHYVSIPNGFQHLTRLSFAEEFNNIQHIGTRPLVTIYSVFYLLLVLIMLNIFLAIVSERYLKALKASQKMWEQLVTTSMEQDRRSRRNIGVQFKGNLWTSAMQNVLVQTRVLGKDVMEVPATKRPSKRFRILGHAIHFDASTVSRESTESSFNVSATSSEKKLLHHNSILDLNAKHLFKMEKTMGELTSMLQNVKAH